MDASVLDNIGQCAFGCVVEISSITMVGTKPFCLSCLKELRENSSKLYQDIDRETFEALSSRYYQAEERKNLLPMIYGKKGFTENQIKSRWCMAYARLLLDETLDRSTRLFAVQFVLLWNCNNEPVSLSYSERELGEHFGLYASQVHLCLKRLQNAGYLRIEEGKNRRKHYIPTEKLAGKSAGIPAPPDRGDLTGITENHSPDYTL
jgi:hypothetical protein